MKPAYIKSIALASVIAACLPLASCIDETFPNDSYVTTDQIDTSNPTVMSAFANAIVSELVQIGQYTTYCYYDLGYPGFCLIRENFTADFPVYDNSYDYFYYHAANTYMGEYATSDIFWNRYYSYVNQCNNLLKLPYNPGAAQYFAMAYFYRAWLYFDMARLYEYKETGFADKDALAESRGLHGLTCPIVTETTTEAEATCLPRAPYEEMYAFILSDIEHAADYIGSTQPAQKYQPGPACVQALKAKVLLDIASHADQYPADLAKIQTIPALAGKTAKDIYQMAMDCASQAIALHPGAPLSESEWYGGSSYSTGFNSMSTPSWMLGLTISKEILDASWFNFTSYTSPETTYGLAGVLEEDGVYSNTYKTQRMIGAELYSKISDNDWRKRTWISPDDAGNPAAVGKYPTSIPGQWFALLPAYTGFKFRPAGGNHDDYSTGAAIDFPMMRIEEMYFVRAEAAANCQGYTAGAEFLSDFLNTYRYTGGTYTCLANTLEGFIAELMRHKRIEFWGEGIIAHDLKRLNMKVQRNYAGTNFVSTYLFNSIEGKCAPWLNGYIIRAEVGKNSALVQNPDPSVSEANRYMD